MVASAQPVAAGSESTGAAGAIITADNGGAFSAAFCRETAPQENLQIRILPRDCSANGLGHS